MHINQLKIDRSQASLFFKIKTLVSLNNRDKLKLSSPDLGDHLLEIYFKSNNDVLKGLIRNFIHNTKVA